MAAAITTIDMFDCLWKIGSAVCHQMADRSFLWQGWQMPLCARCTGIYTGALFSYCFFLWKKRLQGNRPFSTGQIILTAAAILPLAADGFCSYVGLWESNLLLRILTGSLAGVVLPALFLLAGNFDPAGKNERAIYNHTRELLVLLAVSTAWGLGLWLGVPLFALGSVLSVAGVVCFWAGVPYLLLRNIFTEKKLPYGKISIGIAFVFLYLMGVLWA